MWCKLRQPQNPRSSIRPPPWRYIEQRAVAGTPVVCIGTAPALAGDLAARVRLQDHALAIRRLGGNARLAPASRGSWAGIESRARQVQKSNPRTNNGKETTQSLCPV